MTISFSLWTPAVKYEVRVFACQNIKQRVSNSGQKLQILQDVGVLMCFLRQTAVYNVL